MLNHAYIGTEHILLSLISESGGIAVLVLVNLSAEPNQVRQQTSQLISGQQPQPGRWPPREAEPVAEVRARLTVMEGARAPTALQVLEISGAPYAPQVMAPPGADGAPGPR